MDEIDGLLNLFYQKKQDNQQDIGLNIIKGCSEAILYAAASCFDTINLYSSISEKLYQGEFEKRPTKLMLTLFNGGKSNGSNVKF